MADPNEPVHLNATEARGGSTNGVVRYILIAGLVLVIIGFILAYVVNQ
ncbi:MAG TPA: hypothetical protein VEY69_10350 [Lautropia sp.]|jgi:hypothetical protein|nr:hypothetical protein [Lautropia sp.]